MADRLISADALLKKLDSEKVKAMVGVVGIAWVKSILSKIPTVDAVPVAHGPCGFCARFEFDSAKAVIDPHGARIGLAIGSTRYPVDEQFNFCPVCGRFVKKG